MASSTSSSSATAEAPPPGGNPAHRLRGLEMLRGIAAISVVFHHLWSLGTMPQFPGSWIVEGYGAWGVDIFFILSSFLLIGPFLQDPKQPRVGSYFVRRGFRILPAYWASVIILFVFFAQPSQVWSASGLKQFIANITLTFWLDPSMASSLNTNGVYWTLSLEAGLYLMIPLVGWCMRRRPVVTLSALAATGIAWKILCARWLDTLREPFFGDTGPGPETEAIYLSRQLPGVFTLFAIGFTARWIVERHSSLRRPPTWLQRYPTVAVIALLVPSTLWLATIETGLDYEHWRWFAIWDAVLGLLAVPAVVAMAAMGFASGPSRVLRTAEVLGAWSFGIYLWHFPIILSVYGRTTQFLPPVTEHIWLRIAIVLTLAIGFGLASFKLLEMPMQQMGSRVAKRLSRRPATAD